ncbi:unnamed protein product [Durusdinium trenchii]|uniref:Uncharacterized protein n=1 Tax=Durusdinium trenchii TaxID=1381693 RepID=A0ABP0J0Z5_9DINO
MKLLLVTVAFFGAESSGSPMPFFRGSPRLGLPQGDASRHGQQRSSPEIDRAASSSEELEEEAGDTEENQDKHDEGDRWAPADWDAYAYAEAQEWGAMRGEDEEPPQPMDARAFIGWGRRWGYRPYVRPYYRPYRRYRPYYHSYWPYYR